MKCNVHKHYEAKMAVNYYMYSNAWYQESNLKADMFYSIKLIFCLPEFESFVFCYIFKIHNHISLRA